MQTDKQHKNEREIVEQPQDAKGHFICPKEFTRDDETRWAKIRMREARISNYQDTKCGGFPNTYDPAGAYLCGGREDGSSKPCNMFNQDKECLILEIALTEPHRQSCNEWEIENFGDPELRNKSLDAKRIGLGKTDNPDGFGCVRCHYGEQMMPRPDSEGRGRWCEKKGMPVMDNACCAENEPVKLVQISGVKRDSGRGRGIFKRISS